MTIEAVKQAFESLLDDEERATFKVWPSGDHAAYEVAIGEMRSFITEKEIGFDKDLRVAKIERRAKYILQKYREGDYAFPAYDRREMAFEVFTTLRGLMNALPEQWKYHADKKIYAAMEQKGAVEGEKMPLSLLLYRNQIMAEHLKSLILPRKKDMKEAEVTQEVA